MNHFEIERQRFKPKKIDILFIAESPPQGGTFFYFRNSNLYSALFTAFHNVFQDITETTFLEIFKQKGCYLEDLCVNPVNGLNDFERTKARMKGVSILTKKLQIYRPKVIIILMKDIASYIDEALLKSGIRVEFKIATSFPVRSQSNINNCIIGVEFALRKRLTLD
ncbi:MAG: hypothetical protein AAB221_03325 [Bacteroidota bacterium]